MITAQQVDHYRKNGFVAIDAVYTEAECDELNAYAADVVRGTIPLNAPNAIWMEPDAVEKGLSTDKNPEYLFKIGHGMHINDPVFQKYAVQPKLTAILEQLVGPDIKCIQSMYLDKPPYLGVGQPYHQDAWYLKTNPDTLMAVWIACDDAEIENGCIHVIPGSNTDPIFPHEKPIDVRQQKIYIEVHNARTRAEVACPLKKGSAVFFYGHVLHRSGNNNTDRHRRAYVLHYGDAKSKWVNDPTLKNHFLLVSGKEYPGGL